MEEFFKRSLEHLVGRIDGPFRFRIVLQPVVAAVIGLLIGLKDARARRPPFFWMLLKDRIHRRELLLEGWRNTSRVFIVAVLIDVIYTIAVLHWVYPLQSLLVAAVLALAPYALVRSSANWIISRWLYRGTKGRTVAASRKAS